MPIPSEQPRFDQPVVDSSGRATQPWMNYWLLMPSQASLDALTGRVNIIERQIQDIEGDESSSTFKLLGNLSIAVVGMPNPGGVVLLSLLNDVQSPPATSYYGTDASGAKGWFLVESTVQAASGELTKTVDAEGVSTFGLSDLANAGTGSLLALTRDGKGRVTGTKAATITGTTNQINVANGDAVAGLPTLSLATAVMISLSKADSAVQSIVAGTGITVDNTDPRNPIVAATGGGGFGPPPTDGSPYVGLNGVWERANAPDSRFWLIEYPLLTDQAGNQLTDQAGNFLMGNSPILPPGWPASTTTTITTAAAPQVVTLAQANALAGVIDGQSVLITDLSGGRELCWYDAAVSAGTKWRRYSDRSIANT